MVKIKQKKTMNLPQLIEYIEQTDYEACVYQADDAPVYVRVGRIKGIHIEGSGTVFPHNTFTVEVEEEIDEYTVFHTLVKVIEDGTVYTCTDATINREKNSAVVEIHAILNGVLKLIWTHEKGMVE
ncbi:hypothetical protein [Staphylococcus sp. GDY8P46P]|uniref:hypothetical protein n=1 Tax=Staphylococcus sp. GDY8P46P TaxID=2804121 RepID=UPI001AEBB7AD|nr:hypothetical protein [Staphylococcus sp. GDY8P46P]